jgi:hypothetical protein
LNDTKEGIVPGTAVFATQPGFRLVAENAGQEFAPWPVRSVGSTDMTALYQLFVRNEY